MTASLTARDQAPHRQHRLLSLCEAATLATATFAVGGIATRDGATPTGPTTESDCPAADLVADVFGGKAVRVHTDDGDPVPGDLFLLLADPDSDDTVCVYDATPFTHDRGMHPDTLESNRTALAAVEALLDVDLDPADMTSAPGGGLSGGLTYAVAYLNFLSDGAFTGDVVVAATGELRPTGYVGPVQGADEKAWAARIAGADVLFTPSLPSDEAADAAGRMVGELFRACNTGAALSEERRWDRYHTWGHDRPHGTMDVVGTRHLGDVAAYLCGAGSDYACDVIELLDVEPVAGASSATPVPVAAPLEVGDHVPGVR